ncbi:MAG: M56 family metallopeptidase [Myxococcales bacterium]
MAILGFALECAAVAAAIGTAASLLVLAAMRALRPALQQVSASLRGDLFFLTGTLPAAAAVAGIAAAAAPSIGVALGLASDHCTTHTDHLHLCFVHPTGLSPALAALGAFALAAFVFRASTLACNVLGIRRKLWQLERISRGVRGRFPIFLVPGAPRLCHATGVLRPRILLSRGLLQSIGHTEVRGAVAHERAHLLRRDPLANLLLSAAGLFVPPPLAARFQQEYRIAAEEACDADAAEAMGDPALVADALLQVAAAQHAVSFGDAVPAFGELALEARIARLLARERPVARPARALVLTAAAVCGIGAAAMTSALPVHDAVETVLFHLF